jgi:two-component system, OmpR family, sensor histidine kinase KdpD
MADGKRIEEIREISEERGIELGLAIARGLIEAQRGRIWAERREAGGARVSFTLPAAEA